MIAVGRAAASMFGSAMRTLWPQLVSWGVQKLLTSNFGQTYVAPGFHGPVIQIGQRLTSLVNQQKNNPPNIYNSSQVAANSVMSRPSNIMPPRILTNLLPPSKRNIAPNYAQYRRPKQLQQVRRSKYIPTISKMTQPSLLKSRMRSTIREPTSNFYDAPLVQSEQDSYEQPKSRKRIKWQQQQLLRSRLQG